MLMLLLCLALSPLSSKKGRGQILFEPSVVFSFNANINSYVFRQGCNEHPGGLTKLSICMCFFLQGGVQGACDTV